MLSLYQVYKKDGVCLHCRLQWADIGQRHCAGAAHVPDGGMLVMLMFIIVYS